MKRAVILQVLILPLLMTFQACEGNGDNDPVPYIAGVSTQYDGNKVVAGKPVVLKGNNFSPVASENKVLYGFGLSSSSLDVNSSSMTRVDFTAPSISRNQLKIRLSVNGKESNEVTLEYTEAEDDPWIDEPTIELEGAVTETIRPGVEWISFHGTWSGETRNINIVRTTLDGYNHLGIFHNYTTIMNLDEKCEYVNAVAGTNGPAQCCNYIRVSGRTERVANEQDPWVCNCALTIDDNDVVDIVKVQDNFDAAQLPNKNIGCAGPLLVWDGKIQDIPTEWASDAYIANTNPRTAIGLSKDGKTVIQVAVDGRYTTNDKTKRAIGLPIPVLAKLMQGLGCYKAMNLDGGGGTAMWVIGKGDKGIVNHPCDLSDWDSPQASLRATGNAIYIVSDR